MTTFGPFGEAEPNEESRQIAEANIGIRRAMEDE